MHTHSYAEAVDTFESEEELRFLLPMKVYIAYCDSLRYTPHSHLELELCIAHILCAT